ncbi:MAG TPA: MMPL family transporter [Thermomicrobiales bacterium]
MFGAWGRLVYRWRWLVLVVSLAIVAGSVAAILQFSTPLSTADSGAPGSESSRATELITNELPTDGGGSFTLIFTAKDQALKAADPAFVAAVEAALQPLRGDERVTTITQSPNFVSNDGRRLFVSVATRDKTNVATTYYDELRAKVQSDRLDILSTGNLAVNADFSSVTERDLRKAEFVGLPIALVILLLVFGATIWRTLRRSSRRGAALALVLTFGTLIIALIPLLVGGFAILGGLAGIYALAQRRDMTIYSLNIASMIGLGLAIDYSLFIISRFLEEVERRPVGEAIARTIATTGKAITFSGLTVAIGVCGLLFYSSPLLTSIGLSAMLVVGTSVFYGLTFLPALLSIAGDAIARRMADRPASTAPAAHPVSGPWHALATGVMARPWFVLIPLLVILLLAGSPVLRLRLGAADITVLPPEVESRRGYDILVKEFPGSEDTNVPIVVNYPDGQPLTAARIGQLYDYAAWLGAQRDVARVQGVVVVAGPDGKPLPKDQVVALLTAPQSAQPPALQEGIRRTVGAHIVTLTVQTPLPANSDASYDLVRAIRAGGGPAVGGEVLVGGQAAIILDSVESLLSDTKGAVAFIVIATYIVLFLLLGSVLLPLKAVLVNLLSISASYGALVFIFQEGHFSTILGFTPGPIEPVVPVLMFCLLFGLSMDYEVLLLSRMKEEYDRLGDNRAAVAAGLEQTGQLITGAAAIMIAVFAAFALADIVIIKSIGLGMSLAVAIDALVVRTLLVPATMRLLGDRNWWAPTPLARLYQRLGLAEKSSVEHVSSAD